MIGLLLIVASPAEENPELCLCVYSADSPVMRGQVQELLAPNCLEVYTSAVDSPSIDLYVGFEPAYFGANTRIKFCDRLNTSITNLSYDPSINEDKVREFYAQQYVGNPRISANTLQPVHLSPFDDPLMALLLNPPSGSAPISKFQKEHEEELSQYRTLLEQHLIMETVKTWSITKGPQHIEGHAPEILWTITLELKSGTIYCLKDTMPLSEEPFVYLGKSLSKLCRGITGV